MFYSVVYYKTCAHDNSLHLETNRGYLAVFHFTHHVERFSAVARNTTRLLQDALKGQSTRGLQASDSNGKYLNPNIVS